MPPVAVSPASEHLCVGTVFPGPPHSDPRGLPPAPRDSLDSPSAPAPARGSWIRRAPPTTGVREVVCVHTAPDAELVRPPGPQSSRPPLASRGLLCPPRPAPRHLGPERGGPAAGAAPPGGRAGQARVPLRDRGTAGRREGSAAATSGRRAGPAEELGYFVTAPSTQASLPPLNETPLLRDVQPLHLIKEIALQC